jgi:phosphatidylglycerophosphatase A
MMRWLVMTGLGSGLSPFASGTAGSAAAAALALGVWAVHQQAGGSFLSLNLIWCLLIVLAGAGCVHWGTWAIEHFAGAARKAKDPGAVVIDEFAGQWLALVGLPMTTASAAVAVLAVQFFLFRVFDVLKLAPARQLERLPAGWGILMDDLAAAVYANVLGQILLRLIL